MGQRTVKCTKCSLLCAPCIHMTDPRVAVTQQPTHPTGPSCSLMSGPSGKDLGQIYLPCAIHVTLSKSVRGYMAKHSHRQERTFLTAQKNKGRCVWTFKKSVSCYPCRKMRLAIETSFSRTCSSALTVINTLKEWKKIFSERLRIS